MEGSYLGPVYPDTDVEKMTRKYKAPVHYIDNFDQLDHLRHLDNFDHLEHLGLKW